MMVPNALGVDALGRVHREGGGAVRPRGTRHAPARSRDAALRPRTERDDRTRSRPGSAWAVKLDKGDFIGREALQAAANDSTKPVRVGLEIEGKRAAREGSRDHRRRRQTGGHRDERQLLPVARQVAGDGLRSPRSRGTGRHAA